MARYKIETRPTFTGESVGVLFKQGVAEVDGAEHAAALAYFERHDGYAVERLDEEQEPEADDGQKPEPVELPARGDTKATWRTYAIDQGMPEADADAMTRDKLAEHYLGPKEA